MVKKTCPKCAGRSYSCDKDGKWICPHCKRDITSVPAEEAEGIDGEKN